MSPETRMNQDEAGIPRKTFLVPEKVRPRNWVPLLIWLIPILAAAIGVWLVVQTWIQQGPEITITFRSGEGLEAGKTKVKYKEVEIGTVKSITLSEDHTHVLVTVQLKKEAKEFYRSRQPFLGCASIYLHFRVYPGSARCCSGRISGLMPVLKRKKKIHLPDWRRRHCLHAMSPANNMFCTQPILAHWISVRPFITAG